MIMANIDPTPKHIDDWANEGEDNTSKPNNPYKSSSDCSQEPEGDEWEDFSEYKYINGTKKRNYSRDIEDRLEKRRLKRELYGDFEF
jgi:hypothetical protein